jgi:hypothetical protein
VRRVNNFHVLMTGASLILNTVLLECLPPAYEKPLIDRLRAHAIETSRFAPALRGARREPRRLAVTSSP